MNQSSEASSFFILPNLFESLNTETLIDKSDWIVVTRYAERWKLSVADALLDLNYINESTLARALARAHNCTYIPGAELVYDFSEVTLDKFDDLMGVTAVPLTEQRLAVSNPYDDLRGYLDPKLCEREMIVSERSFIIQALRNYGINECLDTSES